MNKPLTAAEAKAQLSMLLDRAAAGQETVITRHGKPVARIAPVAPIAAEIPAERGFGALKGQLVFDDATLWEPMSEQELAEFYDAPLMHDPAPDHAPAQRAKRSKDAPAGRKLSRRA